MQAASSSVTSGGATSPTKTQGQQPQHIPYDANNMQYFYAAPMQGGQQPMQTYVAPNGQAYPPQAYYPDGYAPQQQMMVPGQQYIYMAPPQGGQQVMQPGQPQVIYYQGPPQGAPVYFMPQQMHQEQMMQQMQSMPPPKAPQTAPLTSSTPLPTSLEYEAVQRENARNKHNLQFKYHRLVEHDELPIDEISKITLDNHNDDTMSAEKEQFPRRGGGYAVNPMHDNEPMNYKTRLCMTHASGTKPCEMGARCKFAHGLKELRSTEVPIRYPNNKYKTKLCKNFARGGSGFCPYGLRCEFVHPTDKEIDNIPPYQRLMVEEKAYEQDGTVEDYVVARHQQSRYVRPGRGSTTPTKVLLKHRNIAGSMMCLSQAGRGDSSQDNLPPHLRRNSNRKVHPPMTRRRPSLNTKWTSEENLVHRGLYQ